MTSLVRIRWVILTTPFFFGIGHGASRAVPQGSALADAHPYELNANDLLAVGLHLPSYMPRVAEDLAEYQKRTTTRQELLIEWDPHTGYAEAAPREQVAEHSLKHEFNLKQRKQNIKGDARIGPLMLLDLSLEVVGVTNTGEVRGLGRGPDLLVHGEATHLPGEPTPEHHDSIQSKGDFWVALPDDPKITKIVLLFAHPNENPRLEQVGTIDLTTWVAPK